MQESSKSQLKSFALVMAVFLVCLAIGSWYLEVFWGIKVFASLALIFTILGLFAPILLKPVYSMWMLLARILAFVNTHFVLAFIFYTLFTFIGLILRLVRKDPLLREIENDLESYWDCPEQKRLPRDHYERQF
tara:strand:- start:47 stop:445 length:399 start_codon:yes stop_codon:yes gene_type:complete